MAREKGQNAEQIRLAEARDAKKPWKTWGPYLSERQWGTVREDYSPGGDAWGFVSHEAARSRAYHWGEDGLAGLSDDKQRLCFALVLWNGKDPILKERLFGLSNPEGNHGEDVKECYYYIDNTPTHSYMKYLYKYPQAAFPYADLVSANRARGRLDLEYELIDTGVFADDRYFDVFVEYCKVDPEDILIEITAANRGPDDATLHVLPTLWFRNTWAWSPGAAKPVITEAATSILRASHHEVGDRFLFCEGRPLLLFTENETNNQRLFGTPNESPYVKDGIDEYVVHNRSDAVNPAKKGTKASAHYQLSIAAGASAVLRLRLSSTHPEQMSQAFAGFDEVFARRKREADAFYHSITPPGVGDDAAGVLRQAMAGMLWTKQFYSFEGDRWLREHGSHPLLAQSRPSRNREWFHMVNEHVISMPDKWEYPWYAAWDLAFHAFALSMVDVDFAKEQLDLMLRTAYQHPNGQIPAYEWNFSDVNPPVHAWATLFLYRTEHALGGEGDIEFVKRIFSKLLLNFTWWVNRKDRFGRNVFEGGFLGLDNIGVFDRSAPLPTGGYLEQADGTAWMSLFCQNMMELSIELASYDPMYKEFVLKFVEHFLWIARAVNTMGADGMWDEEDGFYYDVLRFPDGNATRLKVRSLVGLLPLCATTVIEPWQRARVPEVVSFLGERLRRMPELMDYIHATGSEHLGYGERGILALVSQDRLRRILSKMLDENEFLSPYGIRSLSRYHLEHPYTFYVPGGAYRVDYRPAESDTGMFGGNSNWRGPIWMPMNALIIRALLQYHLYYGDSFRVECPTGSGRLMNLFEVGKEISDRLTHIFLRDEDGRRPVFGGVEKFQQDPLWRDYILFYEYFHGDLGAGIGASHQTGWTGLIGKLIQLFGQLDARTALDAGKAAAFRRREPARTPMDNRESA